jgi:hypothetical protein
MVVSSSSSSCIRHTGTWLAFLALLLLSQLHFSPMVMVVQGQKLAAPECLKLGFNSISLQCETCDAIARTLGEDDPLEAECLRCCSESEQDQYETAVLEVDKRMLISYPNLPDIIKAIPEEQTSSTKSSSRKKKKNKDAASEDNVNSAVAEAAKKLVGLDISVSYRFGARPQLYLYKKKGEQEPEKTIHIGTWNMDDFIDFVGSHLKNSA